MVNGDNNVAEDAFDDGLHRSGAGGGFLNHLFEVRTAGLFERYSADELPSFLSGILIGHEIRALSSSCVWSDRAIIHVVGSERLWARYARAFAHLGVDALWHNEDSVAVGLYRIAERAGFTSH